MPFSFIDGKVCGLLHPHLSLRWTDHDVTAGKPGLSESITFSCQGIQHGDPEWTDTESLELVQCPTWEPQVAIESVICDQSKIKCIANMKYTVRFV